MAVKPLPPPSNKQNKCSHQWTSAPDKPGVFCKICGVLMDQLRR